MITEPTPLQVEVVQEFVEAQRKANPLKDIFVELHTTDSPCFADREPNLERRKEKRRAIMRCNWEKIKADPAKLEARNARRRELYRLRKTQ